MDFRGDDDQESLTILCQGRYQLSEPYAICNTRSDAYRVGLPGIVYGMRPKTNIFSII